MTGQHDRSKRWRPWQFGVRAMLLLMLVVASYLGGSMSNEWKRQRELERAKQETEAELRRAHHAQYQAVIQAYYATLSAIPPAGSNGVE